MANKNKLFIAMQGTFTPSEFVELTFDSKSFWSRLKDRRKIKKALKKGNVVIQAKNSVIKNIRLKYILILPANGIKHLNWYREKEFVDPNTRYLYPLLRRNYKILNKNRECIVLKRFTLLEDYLRKEE